MDSDVGKCWERVENKQGGKKIICGKTFLFFFRLLCPNLTVVVCQRKNSKTSTASYNKTGLKTSACVELCESQSSNKTHKHTQV